MAEDTALECTIHTISVFTFLKKCAALFISNYFFSSFDSITANDMVECQSSESSKTVSTFQEYAKASAMR